MLPFISAANPPSSLHLFSFLGWSSYYEFSNCDLSAAQRLILHFLKESGLNIDWEVIRGLTTTAIYGGRVDNKHDERILYTYMEEYFNENILSHLWHPLGLQQIPIGTLQVSTLV